MKVYLVWGWDSMASALGDYALYGVYASEEVAKAWVIRLNGNDDRRMTYPMLAMMQAREVCDTLPPPKPTAATDLWLGAQPVPKPYDPEGRDESV